MTGDGVGHSVVWDGMAVRDELSDENKLEPRVAEEMEE